MLLLFLLLVLNVKLVIKVLAIIFITLYQFRSVSWKNILRQRQLYFYCSIISIGLINYILQLKAIHANYSFTVLFGAGLWILAAAASYHLFLVVQKEETKKLYTTITFFFVLHISAMFLKLLKIMIECGTLNPYTYKGLNQKYYISTGDHISGITFDSPATTAFISAFALIYFLYRRHFILSLAATASLAITGSNLTNIFLVIVLLVVFIFRSDRIQKSFIIVQLCLLIIFLTKISPRDNEYLGRVVYNIIGKTYDLPKKNESIDFIKTQPDSLLDLMERKKKAAQLYIDSISTVSTGVNKTVGAITNISPIIKKDTSAINRQFYQFKESESVTEKINKYTVFIDQNYPVAERDSLKKSYNWKRPGKWIAYLELFRFLKDHPAKLLLGAGIGNFSSRTAFKVTSLGMAGSYSKKISYINPWFQSNHLYVYLNYHSQDQMKHAAANTPDSTYSQLLGEYGIAGFLLFLALYIGFFIRRIRYLTFGLPLLFLLMAFFSVEYLFEQLSVVILFEALLFLDMKSNDPKFLVPGEGQSSS
jgi:hypothetical protein